MFNIIFHIGVIGSGKDYRSNLIIENNKNAIKISFADCLREIIWNTIGWKPENSEQYELFKIENFNNDIITFNGRDLLTLGEAIKEFKPYFFIDEFIKRVTLAKEYGYETVTCSDLRFPLELKATLENELFSNSTYIFCNYKSKKYNCNASYRSEKLAQELIKYKLNDNEIIPKDVLERVSLLELGNIK
jgi:hypothetical protein